MSRERLSKEAGVGLIAAVFVIVILALLGTALVRLLTTEQASVNREFASTQAFLAAETAVEWGVYQVIARGNSMSFPNGGRVFVDQTSGPAGLANCDQKTGALHTNLDDTQHHFATAPTLSEDQELYRFVVEGVCYLNDPEEARRRIEVRFRD